MLSPHPRVFSVRAPYLPFFVLLFALLPGSAWAFMPPRENAHGLSKNELARIRQQIAEARRAIKKLGELDVPKADRKELERLVKVADEAVSRYERIAGRGKVRERTNSSLMGIGVVVLADDITGIGTIDDVLLPILALGLMATALVTDGPPKLRELDEAWQEVTAAMMEASKEAERVKKEAARPRVIPAPRQCRKHFERCQDSYLGKRNSSKWGSSICSACFEYCKEHGWPDFIGDKPCRWWEWMDSMPPEDAPQRSEP